MRICPGCKQENRDDAVHCAGCGQPLSQMAAGAAAPGGTRPMTMPEQRAGNAPRKGTMPEGADDSGPAAALPAGMTVGNWIVDQWLGKGGMGTVYLAHHNRLGHQVVLKVLSPALTGEPRFHSRFQHEAETQARLQHPNIARVLDYVEQDGAFYLVIEHLSGGTLADLIKQQNGPLELSRAVQLTRQSLAGLAYAHQHDVIHRDVTSRNVMLDHLGDAKVTDFGIALSAGATRETTPGVALGTAHYMSPEQIRHPQDIDARTDIYSMGIVLYEMLTGKVPFDAPTDFDIQEAQVRQAPPPPRSINPLVPAALEQVVLKALEKEPQQRYQTCAEFSSALESAARQEAPVAAPKPVAVVKDSATPKVVIKAPVYVPPPKSKMEDFGEAVGVTGSLCLLIWPAFWFGEYAAPLIERILWIVGIHGFETAIKRWHESFSASPYSTWLLIGGFSCWGICFLLIWIGGGLAQRAREKEKQKANA